ncbi:MAG TPA: right-handed parallel beta-helix repeat-containing protein [Planctomycetota bacterium]|nr:right-handed parallel beta-helix repeat-containing protein [Planctomycetota bacterium]
MLAQFAIALLVAAAPEKEIAAAKPGQRVVIAPGEYHGFHLSDVRGLRGQPIVVVAQGAVFKGGIQLSDVAYLEIEGLAVEGAPGNGLNIDDGGTFETPSHHVILRDVVVRDCGGRGNEDGIKLSGVDDFRLERCTVERWGRGGSAVDMVGCHRGVIDGCTIRDREEATAASGVQAKGGTRDVVIRRCRFEHAGARAVNVGGSTGLAYFRPKPEGFEAKDVTVEGCTFVGSEAPIAFVGVDGATVRFNTFFRPRKWFLRILQETREEGFVPCRGGVFADNLVVYRSDEVATPVNVGPGTAPETLRFARNWWFCIDDPARGPPRLPVAEKDAAGGKDPMLGEDLRLAEGSPARRHGADALPAGPR